MPKFSKIVSFGVLAALVLTLAPAASATVGVTAGPTNQVPDPILVKASSGAKSLFRFTIGQDAGETLSSVAVMIAQNGTTTVSSADLANVALYKDDGDNGFDAGDTLVGTQTSVNIGTNTVVSPSASTTASGTFFVTMATGASWSGTAPADSVKATMPSDTIMSSSGVVSHGSATTAAITADTAGPTLDGALAKNTGGTGNKEAGDTIELVFSESTNAPAITNANINNFFTVSNGHSFLDTNGALGAATWNTAGTMLTITLSGTTTPTSTMASVAVGDTVTVVGSSLTDLAGNPATGARLIVGTFAGTPSDGEGDNGGEHRGNCANGLVNGRLYKVGSEQTVYLAAACRLKPFRGAAVFKARGLKFQNITQLDSNASSTITISQKPVLPAGGALIKGSDATVWFVTNKGKRKGFTHASVFLGLGFNWNQIQQISDQDLGTIPADNPINSVESHPEGALIKCGTSATVFEVHGNGKFPFANAESFTGRGHAWENIAVVDCGRFHYVIGASINN